MYSDRISFDDLELGMMDSVELVLRSLRQDTKRRGGRQRRQGRIGMRTEMKTMHTTEVHRFWIRQWKMGGVRRGSRNIVPTIGPLLRNLERLCVNPVNPSRNVSVRVCFNLRRYNNANNNAIKNGYKYGGGRLHPQKIWIGMQKIQDGYI